MLLRRIAIGLVLAFLGALPAMAQDFQKGMAAAKRGDYASALKELRPLAEKGDSRAQSKLASMYRNGLGVPKNYAEAIKWYRRAIDQGSATAQIGLGKRSR